jgi:hypothetical protein
MDSPDGSCSQCIIQNLNQDEPEEPGPHWSIHAASVLNRSIL